MEHLPGRAERWLARILAVALLCGGAGTVALRELRAEPWPAPLMPRFAGVPAQGGATVASVVGEITVIERGGDEHVVEARDLVASSVGPQFVIASSFGAGLDHEGQLLNAPRGLGTRFLFGQTPGWVLDGSGAIAHHPATVRWLRHRLSQLLPDVDPATFRVTWVRVTRDRSSDEVLARDVVKVVDVELS